MWRLTALSRGSIHLSCSSPKSPDAAGDLFSSCSGFRLRALQPGLHRMLLERGLTSAGATVCHVTGGTEKHRMCALKTFERPRKPRAEAPGGDLFKETCKNLARGASVLCIHDKITYSHPPSLVNALTLHPRSPHGASQPREPSGHEHLPLHKANRPAIMGVGQQLKIAQKAE